MLTALFGSENAATDWSAKFSTPTKTFVAMRSDEVISLLDIVSEEARAGNFVVLMLSYESAPAFDSALVTHENAVFPLAWAAVFSEATSFDTSFTDPFKTTRWQPLVPRTEYDSNIAEIQELIARGHTYQVNYTFPLTARFDGDALAYFDDLTKAQGAKYSAYLDLGRYKALSLSPELFFARKGDHVWTRPMKGTIKRGRWPEEDAALASALENSEKDRAENVMIVDLLRNDLGKVSVAGSVSVTSQFELERFETVWQMTSTVESQLKPGTSLVDLMRALFPCGSITGAPKIRTMEIIKQLERHPRGLYTGTIGFIRPNGDCIFNVAIRTVVLDSESGAATFGVGGGVTIDSTAEREYEECLVKAKFLDVSPEEFDLFESILLEDGEYFLLEKHIQRLKSSAHFFGFHFSEEAVMSQLEEMSAQHASGRWKIKLALTRTGAISSQISELGTKGESPLRVAVARSPVNSAHRLLFHKTTAREFYDSELEARPDCDDVIFYNERDEVTESTIANVVVRIDGKLFTPPRSSGLLAGTFRDQLIVDGEIEERIIAVEELEKAEELFLINSVRKWMQVALKVSTITR